MSIDRPALKENIDKGLTYLTNRCKMNTLTDSEKCQRIASHAETGYNYVLSQNNWKGFGALTFDKISRLSQDDKDFLRNIKMECYGSLYSYYDLLMYFFANCDYNSDIVFIS